MKNKNIEEKKNGGSKHLAHDVKRASEMLSVENKNEMCANKMIGWPN